jgi:hypothetical protein
MASDVIKQIIYRDSVTGRFVSKTKWKRSKGHGGKRYKRETVSRRKAQVGKTVTPPVFIARVQTFFASFKYTNLRGTRSFDFIVRAKNAGDVPNFVARFVKNHPKFETGVDNIFHRLGTVFGWTEPPRIVASMSDEDFPELAGLPEGTVHLQ